MLILGLLSQNLVCLGAKENLKRDSSLNFLCIWSRLPLCETIGLISGDGGKADVLSRMTAYASW